MAAITCQTQATVIGGIPKDVFDTHSVVTGEEFAEATGKLADILLLRHREALRVASEMARRSADIREFFDSAAPVVFIYSSLLRRQQQVTEAQTLVDPDPTFKEELKAIAEAVSRVEAMETEIVSANALTRQRALAILEEQRQRREGLDIIGILEDVFEGVGEGLKAVLDGVSNVADEFGMAVGDLGREVNKGWNNVVREFSTGVENVFREITSGICRIIHGSPDSDKNGDNDGVNDGYYECMNEGFQVSVQIDGDGNVTGVGVDPPGIPGGTLTFNIVTDADRRAQEELIKKQKIAIREFNSAIKASFQPPPQYDFEKSLYTQIANSPENFFQPFGVTNSTLIIRDKDDPLKFIDRSGKEWASKLDYKISLTESQIGRTEVLIQSMDDVLIDRDFIMLGEFFFASKAVTDTAIDMITSVVTVPAQGALKLFGVTQDLASGDDVSLRLLVSLSNIPMFNAFESWMMLTTWQREAGEARASQKATRRLLKEQKKLLEDNLKELRNRKKVLP